MLTPTVWRGGSLTEPPTLTGRHVRLEPLAPSHAADLHAASQSPEIWTWIFEPKGPFQSVEATEAWIASSIRNRDAGILLPLAIVSVETGRVIGATAYYWEPRWPNRTVEIGSTWLGRDHWRTAANTEAKLLLLTFAFESLGCCRVEFMSDVRNERSQRALERIGAVREGVLRANMIRADGTLRDSVYYGVIETEWPAVKARLTSLLNR